MGRRIASITIAGLATGLACRICSTHHHTCFVEPMTSPLTFVQSMLASISSSTKPASTTLSPRTMYSPWSCSLLGVVSSFDRITRSTVF